MSLENSSASSTQRPIRVLMAKVGLDGHDRGAKVVMTALRDAGMEVVYSGLHQTPQAVVRAAVEEDVDVVGLSILSGAHNDLVPRVLEEMKRQGIAEKSLVLGGIIPPADIAKLKKIGVFEVFTPGTSLESIVNQVRGAAQTAREGGPKISRKLGSKKSSVKKSKSTKKGKSSKKKGKGKKK